MKEFTKPALIRIARQAGIKTISDDCYDLIRTIISLRLKELCKVINIVHSQKNTKTIMADDVYEAFSQLNLAITTSSELEIKPCSK